MAKFLVVEDEQYARKSLLFILTELNGGDVFEAENGAAALNIVEREGIDAVITDIQMPVMDGLELIRALNKNRERVAIAVLSGHDEFAYVQTAMECAAIDYVLKPFDRNAIMKLYYKIIRKLRARTSLDQEIANLMLRANQIRPFIKQRFFLDLIGGGVDAARLREMREYLGLHLSNRAFRLCLIEVDEGESALDERNGEAKFCLYNILEIIEKIVGEWRETDCFNVSSNMVALLWSPSEGAENADAFLQNVELLTEELFNLYGVVVNVALSGAIDSPGETARAYAEARDLLKYKLIYGSGQIFDDVRLRKPGAGRGTLPDATQIVEAVWRNAPEQALRLFEEAFRAIERDAARFGVASVNLYFQKILTDCLLLLERESADIETVNARLGVNTLNWRASECARAEAFAFFRRFVPEICRAIARTRNDEKKEIIVEAKKMIARDFASPINVGSLAGTLHFSKNYFGQMFKAETGMSVAEYINLLRVQRAKELLLENRYKIYEIAETVGFNDQQYFTKVFKKIVGCMPSEYRQ